MATKIFESKTGVQAVRAANSISDDYATRIEIAGQRDYATIWTPKEAIGLAIALLKWAHSVKRRPIK